MMKLRSLIFIALTVCMFASLATAQGDVEKADKLLTLKAFDLAIKNYEAIVATDPSNALAFAQLGDAYRMADQSIEAIRAYEKAFELSDNLDKKYVLQYAHTLKRLGLYAQASSWYASYRTVDESEADHQVASVEYAKDLLQKEDKYELRLFDFNSGEADFAPVFYKDNIVFASFRTDMQHPNQKLNDSHIQPNSNMLYRVSKQNAGQVSFFDASLEHEQSIASLSFSDNGTMMAFMKNNFTQSSQWIFTDESDMSIYYMSIDSDDDSDIAKPFPFNEVEYAYAFPSLSPDGQTLYFSSNRPGGFGGFDIYVSYLREGEWTAPENLGAEVNSKGNEVTPFYDSDNLYFSSDYHEGMGGYDVFSSALVGDKWTSVENMGKGLNSPADDYYAIRDKDSGAFYLSSNRLGGEGGLDIYIAQPLRNAEELVAAITPPAVDLEKLVSQNANQKVKENGEDNVTMRTVSASEAMSMEEEALYDVAGATLLSAVEESEEVFFVQLASLTRSKGETAKFNNVEKYGQLYRFFKSDAVKIRLGYYNTRSEAETVLSTVKRAGYWDAFVTSDVLSMSQFDLIDHSSATGGGFIDDYNVTSKYKVKLAAYTDPLSFNVEGIKDAGRIEQWTKGKWTIFVLGGFSSLEDAQRARIKAVNRGWPDAEIVVDEAGILRKLTSQ